MEARNNISLCSCNCKGIKRATPYVSELCYKYDIVVLQEHWLLDTEIALLNNVNDSMYSAGVSAVVSGDGILRGRPHGGVGVLWKRSLAGSVEILYYDDVRLIGLQIVTGNETMLILCVYMPVCTAENLDDFVMYLGKIRAIVMASETANVIVIGDFNAPIDSRFGRQLSDFCDEYCYIRSDLEFLGHNADIYTFVSEAHDSVSWLDHCICTTGAHNSILSVTIGDKSPITDHLPLIVVMSYNSVMSTVQSSNCNNRNNCANANLCTRRVKWENQSKECINNYTAMTMKMISEIDRHKEAELCSDVKCVDTAHSNAIDKLYMDVVSALESSAGIALSADKIYRGNATPGWKLYRKSILSFKTWCDSGKPRVGQVTTAMRDARRRFKYALRLCKHKVDQMQADGLAKSLMHKDTFGFWKAIHKSVAKRCTSSNTVDGKVGAENIALMWQEHFSDIFQTVSNTDTEYNDLKHRINESMTYSTNMNVSRDEMQNSILCMKPRKSAGSDGLTSEHIKYAHESILECLQALVHMLFVHSYVPVKLTEVILVPLVKNKNKDITDKNNYRPIAIANILSKVLEKIILTRIYDYILTCDNQFGFKKSH